MADLTPTGAEAYQDGPWLVIGVGRESASKPPADWERWIASETPVEVRQ